MGLCVRPSDRWTKGNKKGPPESRSWGCVQPFRRIREIKRMMTALYFPWRKKENAIENIRYAAKGSGKDVSE